MSEIDDPIVSTTLNVSGVRSQDEVRVALQALFDVFADLNIGQATFEVTDTTVTRLVLKHKKSVTPDRVAIAETLAAVGDIQILR